MEQTPQQEQQQALAEFLAGLSEEDRVRLVRVELASKEARIEATRAQLDQEALMCELQRKYRLPPE